jgi:hypothetical protein
MKKINNYIQFVLFVGIVASLALTGCRKDKIHEGSDVKLTFSGDIRNGELITFDTVFTTIGSVTRVLKVLNPYKNPIKTDISLLGGNISSFNVNVDGVSGTSFKDVEIRGKDSIFIFIKVNLNQNAQNMPMVIVDTLAFFTNGNRQNVELVACGEDAIFITPTHSLVDDNGRITMRFSIVAEEGKHVTWTKNKPYVIYGYALIDSDAKLTIEAGTRIYLHKGAGIWVFIDGCIHVNGTKEDSVVFQGDRRSEAYERDFAQWDKVWICEGKNDNIINYAVIKNAFIGIQAEILDENLGNKLILTNTEIRNSQLYNFLGRGYTVEAYNNVFSNSVNFCVALHAVKQGGNYTFINNTIYNQYFSVRTTPAVLFSNYYLDIVNNTLYISDFKGRFINNIVYGNKDNELDCAITKDANFELYVENCLIKTKQNVLDKFTTYSNIILNEDPSFEDYKKYDFRLQGDSPCKRAGKTTTEVKQDITGTTRNNPPSIGAYE